MDKSIVPLFTERELEIIRLICCEYSTAEIGKTLELSNRIIEGYRDGINKKIKTNSNIGVLLFAIKHGIFKIE